MFKMYFAKQKSLTTGQKYMNFHIHEKARERLPNSKLNEVIQVDRKLNYWRKHARSGNFCYSFRYGKRKLTFWDSCASDQQQEDQKVSLQHSKYQFLAHESRHDFVQLFWTGKWYQFSKYSLAYSQLGNLNLGASRSNGFYRQCFKHPKP